MDGFMDEMVTVPSGLPLVTRKATTRTRKMASTRKRTIVPRMPVHLPHFSSISESPTMAHTTRTPTMMDDAVPIGVFR